VVVDPYNHTQVQVVSVDVKEGTMTFNDIEGETNTWRFEPAGLAHDPSLKPGERVTIVWKADASGAPIQKILGVAAFTRPVRESSMEAHWGPRRPSPAPRAASPAPAASPSAPPPQP
jgi:hypothetical protein